ncbi:Flp family type IVb pilin [Dendrosporobacter sp. 1207_IL3150]|uniref:Flp family type IVb pilin n=1 Tax=Dendrosporobacter sp. 1207_IL3150 TaxID=3084054 RepID=UPI002FD99259
METMVKMMMWWEKAKSAVRNEKGQGMVEYGLILALIAVVVVGTMTVMGNDLNTKMTDVSNKLK